MKRFRYILFGVIVLLIATAAVAFANQRHHATHSGHARTTHAAKAASEPTSPDTDNLQVGDQTSPDGAGAVAKRVHSDAAKPAKAHARASKRVSAHQAGAVASNSLSSDETSGDGEQSVESEAGQPGEPVPGHQDASGQADHQCQGNCVE